MSDWGLEDAAWEKKAASSTPSVLVVDDDASIRSMLGFLFEDEGWIVREAGDGAEALDALRDLAPDAMVLDLMMPGVDGFGVLRTRTSESLAPDTRILILTAKSDPSDVVWCWELGADEFKNKPVDPEELLRELKILLRKTPEEVRARREAGLAEARRLDAMERAFSPKNPRT